jgi:chemotaxis protein methyltransferase CheR
LGGILNIEARIIPVNPDTLLSQEKKREFSFSERDFRFIQRLLYERSGIMIADVKQDMVYGRLARRLRQLKLPSFSDYCHYLSENQTEEQYFLNALTTNLTAFFRENHHFEYIQRTLMPELLLKKTERSVRIWSAGCSTGEEPYSIAMTFVDLVRRGWHVQILATDIDSDVLQKAATGVYPLERLESIPQQYLKRYFLRGQASNQGMARLCQEIRDMISFRQLNLMGDWPMRHSFDVIFCRNVIIYFDKPTQRTLVDRYAEQLVADGRLFLGHSESLHCVSDRFRSLGQTMYQKMV